MIDLGVELNAPCPLAADPVGRHADVLRRSDDPVPFGNARDRVAVRHPHLRRRRKIAHQRVLRVAHGEHRTAVLAAGSGLHLAAEGMRKVLRAVADAQQRQPAPDRRKIGRRSLGIAHREGAARENHAPHRRVDRRNPVEGVDLAIDVQLAHTPRDELRVLRPEVENDDFFLHSMFEVYRLRFVALPRRRRKAELRRSGGSRLPGRRFPPCGHRSRTIRPATPRDSKGRVPSPPGKYRSAARHAPTVRSNSSGPRS